MSYKIPPDKPQHETEPNKNKQTDILVRPERPRLVKEKELIETEHESEIQMSSSSVAAVDKLKEIINGKLFDIDKNKKENLKRSLEKLESRIREKKLKLQHLKDTIGSSINSTSRFQIDSTRYKTSMHCFQPASDNIKLKMLPLPPTPTAIQLPKPILTNIESELPNIIQRLLQSSSTLDEPSFRFEVSNEASEFNMKKLRDNNFNLHKLLNEKQSVTSYGSEFKSVQELET